METFILSDNRQLSVILFRNVTNCGELRSLATSGNLEGAVLSTNMIIDPFQLLIAALKAVENERRQKMTTKTLYAELIYCLSPDKSISASFKRFGISDSDHSCLILYISERGSDGAEIQKICDKVLGDIVSLKELADIARSSDVQKLYKVTDAELHVGTLLDAVVGRIASKDFISF